jgi:hypothetical protein
MLQTTEPAPVNSKALISAIAAFAAILCFCGEVVPIPLTALVCFPLTGFLGLIAVVAGIAGLDETRARRERGHNLALAGTMLGGAVILAALCMTIVGVALLRLLIDAFRHWTPGTHKLDSLRLPILQPSIMLVSGVVRSRWASWSSKPVAGRVASRGGFDSHPLPQKC